MEGLTTKLSLLLRLQFLLLSLAAKNEELHWVQYLQGEDFRLEGHVATVTHHVF